MNIKCVIPVLKLIWLGVFFPMTVPAGSFAALVVGGVTLVGVNGQTVRSDYYFAMDIGILRRDSRIDGQPGETTELMCSVPLGEQTRSWGDLKALFRQEA